MQTHSNRQHGNVKVEDSIGQFSYGPATQTTVVTTTTTTTTKFPPFVMHASRSPDRLDPKLYPLANAQTPVQLRKIVFSHHGKQVVFREAPDTTLALEDVVTENERLTKGRGIVRSVHQSPRRLMENPDLSRPSSKPMSDEPASPTSIADEEEMEEDDDDDNHLLAPSSRTKRTQRRLVTTNSGLRGHPRLQEVQVTNPLTPETQGRPARASRGQAIHTSPSRGIHNQTVLPSPDAEQQGPTDLPNPRSPPTRETSFEDEIQERINLSRNNVSRSSHETTVPTPPVEPEDGQPISHPLSSRSLSSIPSRLQVTESPAQEGNLPSPSLSPVTAAANAQLSSYFMQPDAVVSARSPTADHMALDNISPGRYGSPAETEAEEEEDTYLTPFSFTNSSISNIPAMLDFFEVLPSDMKSYVIHQLLRRCPKTTLHVVAEAVNPALKCDFLTLLPPELALNILGYLDVKSLCRASQVSKKWRYMINGDERAWKRLFDADGFTLPDGELQLAISQGWGWQDPSGVDGFEQDLTASGSIVEDVDSGSPGSITTVSKKWSRSTLRRSKRKAASFLASDRSKQVKRYDGSRETSAELESVEWMSQLSASEGPYNAANLAIMAVSNPNTQMPSLRGLHLYKSLYRRHHLIRRNWMVEDTKPRHIAFRAHDSHVVTCLQFDTEKILTGSDDNNINVYDTKTGALRQLLRGHEGGVWALQYEGNTLVSGSTDRSVRVWDIERGIETQVFRGHTSTVRCLQIVMPVKVGETTEGKPVMMPKQPLIITGSRDSTLRVWKLPRPGEPMFIQAESDAESDDCPYYVRTLTGHQHSVRAIAAHADTLVSGSYDCTVRVWKISTGETVHRLQGHSQKVYSVVLDHSRNRCISGSMDNLVKIWSLDTGSALYTLEGHSSLVGLLDLNCDRLVSAAADSTLRIWDPENGQCKATLSAHTGAITCFQHDGQKVISGSDRNLKMWNIKTGECMKDLLSDLSGVWQVKFNERRCVAAVQRDNMTYIEVLDFGASRDGIPESQRGRRIVVDAEGHEVDANSDETVDADPNYVS